MAYGNSKYLNGRTVSDKILGNKGFIFAKNSKYEGYQRILAAMVYKSFDKKASGRDIKNENMYNKELAEELNTPKIRKFN